MPLLSMQLLVMGCDTSPVILGIWFVAWVAKSDSYSGSPRSSIIAFEMLRMTALNDDMVSKSLI